MILQHVVGLLEGEVWWVWAADILHLKLPSNPSLNKSRLICRVSKNPLFSVVTSSRPKRNQGKYQLGISLLTLTENPQIKYYVFSHNSKSGGRQSRKCTVFYYCYSILSSVMASFCLHVAKLLLQFSHHICVLPEGRLCATQLYLWEGISPSKGIALYYWPEMGCVTSPRCQGLWVGEEAARIWSP